MLCSVDDEDEGTRLTNEIRISPRLKKLSNCQLTRVCKPRTVDKNASAYVLSLILMVCGLHA
jgi:hypothetical protein